MNKKIPTEKGEGFYYECPECELKKYRHLRYVAVTGTHEYPKGILTVFVTCQTCGTNFSIDNVKIEEEGG